MLDTLRSLAQTWLGIGAQELTPGQMALRAVLTFAVTLVIVRLGDKRLLGKGTAFDLVVSIMIGSVMSRAITNSSPVLATWVAGAVLIGMHWLLALMAFHLGSFGSLIKGHPVLLMEDGRLLRDEARKSAVTRNDIEQAMRAAGEAPDLASVQCAYLERDGTISVIRRNSEPRVLDIAVADGVQTVRIALE